MIHFYEKKIHLYEYKGNILILTKKPDFLYVGFYFFTKMKLTFIIMN